MERLLDIVLIVSIAFGLWGLMNSFRGNTFVSMWRTEIDRLQASLDEERRKRRLETQELSIELQRERYLRRSLEDHCNQAQRSMQRVLLQFNIPEDIIKLPEYHSPLAERSARNMVQMAMVSAYNMDEIHQMMFDLNINKEVVKGDTITELVRELVWYMERNSRFADLVIYISNTRPNLHIEW